MNFPESPPTGQSTGSIPGLQNFSIFRIMARKAFHRLALLGGFWGILACFSPAQENPFELTPRLTVPPAAGLSENKDSPAPTGNPFELIPRLGRSVEREPSGAAPDNALFFPSKAKERKSLSTTFLLGVTLALLVFLAILLTLFRPLLQRIIPALFNQNQFNLLYRELEGINPWPFRLLYFFFFCNAGFFLLQLLWPGGLGAGYSPWVSLAALIAFLAAAFGLKHLLLKLLSAVFPIARELDSYGFSIRLFSIALGMILLPINVLLAFAPESLHSGLIYLVLAFLILAYLLRTLRGLSIAGKKIWSNKFHFLLYICSVEIAPVFVLVKLIISQL